MWYMFVCRAYKNKRDDAIIVNYYKQNKTSNVRAAHTQHCIRFDFKLKCNRATTNIYTEYYIA